MIGKKFGKNLWENVSGKEMPPILDEIEGEVLIMDKRSDDVFGCKDSGIIRDCKRRVLSFCFRTKEPF